MKITRFVSLFTALIAVVGLWGFVFVDDATAGGTGICVTPDGRNVPCSSGGGGGGPGGGGPSGPTLEESEQAWEEQDLQEAADDASDTGIEFYEKGDWANAIRYFREALEYKPDDDDILHNLRRAEARLEKSGLRKGEVFIPAGNFVPDYLSSVQTALDIVSVTPSLLIFHPSPSLRAEAQKELARKTMEKVVDETAKFVVEESTKQGKLIPFRDDTEAEKATKRRFAKYDSATVESLRLEAHKEVREKAEELKASKLQSGKNIRITPGPAMSELLDTAILGFR